MAVRKVTTIAPTLSRFTATPILEKRKRKVAGYARVSTDHDDQYTSYEAQIDYYTKYIAAHNDWEFVNVYTDEGITGTSTKHRNGFNLMISDALSGKIDLIVTKSVSRFARNTVDSLTTIRKLKERGVECYFEKENIWTFDGKGELLITIMSSLAQEESRSISENCTWGQRKRMQDGKVSVPFGRFLGYDRGPSGELVINPEQAEVVRKIYSMFIGGLTPHSIAVRLTKLGIPTPGGKTNWSRGTVRSILRNEKYKGDALLQKSFTEDFLTKKMIRNDGQIPQYYVAEDHEAIISPDVFEIVQRMLDDRKTGKGRYSGVRTFSGTVFCGECGGMFGSKVWHSNDQYRRIIWQCNRKYDRKDKHCHTPSVDEDRLEKAFLSALGKLNAQRDEIYAAFEEIKETVYNTGALQAELDHITAEMNRISDRVNGAVRENATIALDQAEYAKRYNALCDQYDQFRSKAAEIQASIDDKETRRAATEEFLQELMKQPETIEKFDSMTYHILVERMIVYEKDRIEVQFKNGVKIET